MSPPRRHPALFRRAWVPAALALRCLLEAVPLFAQGQEVAQPVPVRIEESRRHYPLDADSLDGLREQLALRGRHSDSGERVHGLTEVALTTRFELAERPNGCALQEAEVVLELVIWLPEWQPLGSPARGLAARWQSTLRGLHAHEEGHRQLAITAAGELARELAAIGVRADCSGLRRHAHALLIRHMTRLSLGNERYDQRTASGRRQGATL